MPTETKVKSIDGGKMIRKIIRIDKEKCNGCGACADACHESAIDIINGKAEVECSGNVTAENVKKLTDLGVDYISCGALTHSAPILDLSMKNLHPVVQ